MILSAANFHANLRDLREARQLTQRKLAESGGFDPTEISQFESGRRRPNLKNFCRLVEALGCKPEELLR